MNIDSNIIWDYNLDGTDMIFDCQFHPKRDWVAFSTIEGNVNIVNMEDDSKNIILNFKKLHKGSPVRRVRFMNDLMFTVSKTIKITDLAKQKVIRTIENDRVKIYSILIADEYLLCIGDDDGNFKVWDYRVERPVHLSLHECDGFISDLDIDQNKRLVVASSGEGTLSAFNIRARRMEEPQSELFDSGFQCVRFVEDKNKVAVGTEDGVLNFFNINEWGNISDRFPFNQNSNGLNCIDCMEMIDSENNLLIIGSSDGSLQAASLFPHKILNTFATNSSGIECLDVNQITKKFVCASENNVKLFSYKISKLPENSTKRQKHGTGFFDELLKE